MEEEKKQKEIQFKDIKKDLLLELNKEPRVDESTELIDGFINQPYNMELSNNLIIGGPTIPMIMLLGKKTGKIYFFALKAILKENLEKYAN